MHINPTLGWVNRGEGGHNTDTYLDTNLKNVFTTCSQDFMANSICKSAWLIKERIPPTLECVVTIKYMSLL